MNQLSLQTAFTIPETVLFRELDGESVLLNLDSGQYYGLNEVGTRMWQLLAEAARPELAVEPLLAEFDVAREELEADMLALLQQLAAKGLIAAQP
jgi:hypothetical protein